MKHNRLKLALTALILGLALGGCQEDNKALTGLRTNVANVAALSLNSKLSVVEAKSSTSNANIQGLNVGIEPGLINAAIDPTGLASTSDYGKDQTEIFVYEQSAEAMDTVNSILCSINQTQFGEFVNQGPFKAQVDDNQCDSNGGKKSDSSTGSSSSTPSYSYWTLEVTRLSNSSPQVVTFWIDDTNSDEPQWIEAKMTITEGKSTANPMGIFRMDFVGYTVDVNGAASSQNMSGFMETSYSGSNVKLDFYNFMKFSIDFGGGVQNFEPEFAVSIIRSPDGITGSGTSSSPDFESFTGSGAIPTAHYNIAYNSEYFYKTELTNNKTTCLDRNDFQETAWSYGLYDSTGTRVSRNSGFPIKVAASGQDYFGYIGYWGLWMPASAGITNGSTVSKMDWGADGNETTTDYTVFQVGGKLFKHTKQSLTLDDIKGIPLNMNDFTTGDEYQVIWNGTALVKTAKRNPQSWNWETITETETAWTFTANDFSLWFWSEALGGDGQIKLKDFTATAQSTVPTVSATTGVVFHTRDVAYPGDTIPAALRCFNDCPDPSKLGDSTSDYSFAGTNWNSTGANVGVDYSFDSTSHLLKYGTTSVLMTTAGSGFYANGLHTGPMFEWNTTNQAALACPWDATRLCPFQAYEKLDVFYTWETGPNDWSKFTTLKDASDNYLKFQAPLPIKYKRTTATPTKYKDATFYLNYSGFGDLQGIPTKCINVETGAESSCFVTSEEEARKLRWIPEFVIPNGTNVTGADATGDDYVVKALEMEQTMKSVAESVCTGAGLTLAGLTLPTAAQWIDPALPNAPTVTGPPAVVAGVVTKTTN